MKKGWLIGMMLALALAGAGCSVGASAKEPGVAEPLTLEFALFQHRTAPLVQPSAQTGIELRQVRTKSDAPKSSRARNRVLLWIRSAELRHGLPLGLLDAVIAIESAYLPWRVSRAGAAGLTQLMPATAVELGVRDRFDPVQSIDGGARYLRQQLDQFGSVSLALAAYNAGPGVVRRSRGIPRNGETPDYVTKVIRRWLDGRSA